MRSLPAAGLLLAALAAAQESPPVQFESPTGWFLVTDHPDDPDLVLAVLWGGFLARIGELEVRGERALAALDRDEYLASLREALRPGESLPRVGLAPPKTKPAEPMDRSRLLLEALLAAEQGGAARAEMQRRLGQREAQALRHFYVEGGVTLERRGLRLLRAARFRLDLQDGSFIAEDAILRLPSRAPSGTMAVINLKAPRVVARAGRIQARNATVTWCDHEEPHYHVAVAELEAYPEEGAWVISAGGATLKVGSVPLLWLPGLTWRTDEKGPLPLTGVSAGRSSKWGYFLFTEWGDSFGRQGRRLAESLGVPSPRFKGEWRLETGFAEKHGVPLELGLEFGVPRLYESQLKGFYLHDTGRDHRGPVRREPDGSPFPRDRWLAITQNRIFLEEDLTLDLQSTLLGDAGVLPEFFEGTFKRDELPESSAHLSWAADNRLLSLLARAETNGFAYAESRALADSFVEEMPSAAFLWSGEPLLDLPWGQQLLLTLEGEASRFNRNFTDALDRPGEGALRSYLEAELSAPFNVGPIRFRPSVSAAGLRYDRVDRGEEGDRALVQAEASASLFLSRFHPIRSRLLDLTGLIHQAVPEVAWRARARASGQAAGRHPQLDHRDALDDRQEVALALRNRLVTRRRVGDELKPVTVMRADLEASFFPEADRDNGGEPLGLLSFELAWQPQEVLSLAPSGPSLSLEGDYDPGRGEMKTLHLNGGLPLGGLSLFAGWVRAAGYQGTVYGSASLTLVDRWQLVGSTAYDLERDTAASYRATLLRLDHDWTLGLELSYDEGENDYRISFQVLPGGALVRQRRLSRLGMDPLDTML